MKRVFSILGVLIAFSAISYGQNDSTEIYHYKTKQFDCVIYPKEDGNLIGSSIRFTPTKFDVDEAEKALRDELEFINKDLPNQDGSKQSPFIHKNLKKYKRQYFGYINGNGHKILYINFMWFKDGAEENWMNCSIMVNDGGSYYWEIEYNLDTKELLNFSVNGYG